MKISQQKIKLSNGIAAVRYGKAKPIENIGSVPVVGSSGIYGCTNNPLTEKPTVVVGRKGTAGMVYYFDKPIWPSDTTFYLDINTSKITPKFLYYFLFSKKMNGKDSQTTLPSFKRQDLESIEVFLPEYRCQQKIVKVLDGIREMIDGQKEIIEKTKELKVVLMKKLLTEGTMREKLKETEIGKIPVSWEVEKLGNVCQKPQYGFTASGSQDEKIGPKYIRITDIQDDKIDWQNVPYCHCKKIDKYLLVNGDVLVARIGATTGKTVLFNYNEKAVFASYLIRIRPNPNKLNPIYLTYFSQTNFYWDQIKLQKGGRLKGGINVPVLQNLILQLPKVGEQKEIVSVLQKIDERIELVQKRKEMYEELFNAMLNKLMEGKINVENVKI